MDFNYQRKQMVTEQLESRGISDPAVLQAFRTVSREKFVPPPFRHLAYIDAPLDIGEGQTISQPYTVAAMTELLQLQPTDKVLEIGTGSGYQAAILAEIVKEGRVYSIERIESLAEKARALLEKLAYHNVRVIVGDGSKGLPQKAPFDAIVVTAAAPEVPEPLVSQLAIGGRLVIPVGSGLTQQMCRLRKRSDGSVKKENFGAYRFVPLIGEHGVKE